MSKKNLFKKMGAAVVATMMVAAMSLSASAATVTANLYIPSASNPVMSSWDAYFTSSSLIPRSAASNNAEATLNSDGSVTVEVPLGATLGSGYGLALLGIDSTDSTKSVSATLSNYVDVECSSHSGASRAKAAKFTILKGATSGTNTYTFSNAKSHAKAKLPLLGIDNDSIQTTPAVFVVDLTGVVE